jgi:hypothetical protein
MAARRTGINVSRGAVTHGASLPGSPDSCWGRGRGHPHPWFQGCLAGNAETQDPRPNLQNRKPPEPGSQRPGHLGPKALRVWPQYHVGAGGEGVLCNLPSTLNSVDPL